MRIESASRYFSPKFLLKLRDPFSALSHAGGAVAALVGIAILLYLSPAGLSWTISLLVYGAGLFLLFAASATYHAVDGSPRLNEFLRKLDHSAIYLLIAATYTPFCANAFTGFWHWGMLAVVWSLAVLGILVKVFVLNAPRWLTAGVYVLMGWLSVFAVRQMFATLPRAVILWMFVGGVVYTLGAAVYVAKKPDPLPGVFGFHEVWHIFVLLGAAAHFAAVTGLLLRG